MIRPQSLLSYSLDNRYANRLDAWFVERVRSITNAGELKTGRNGDTHSVFGDSLCWDMEWGFPIITSKKTNFVASFGETMAFLAGADMDEDFRARGCNFWTGNATSDYWLANPNRPHLSREEGPLGRIYGVQWRHWRGVDGQGRIREVDQIAELLKGLRADPHGRRHIVSAWQPAEFDQMALPPCHSFFQVYCHEDSGISLRMYQRSADLFLGVPYNITSYAILLSLLARFTGRTPKYLQIDFGDLHMYDVHESRDGAVTKLLAAGSHPLPTFGFDADNVPADGNFDLVDGALPAWAQNPTNFWLKDYVHEPFIKAGMEV
jgi:thymidylate synthase